MPGTLVLDSQPPELWDVKFLVFESCSLWYFCYSSLNNLICKNRLASFPRSQSVVFNPWLGGSSEKAMAPHSSTLAWKIPWMEEPGGLQSMGSRRVGHNWATSLSLFTFMHWRRKWQPTPVFLPGESQGWGEPGGLLSVGSHRVGQDWSDLAAAVEGLGICLLGVKLIFASVPLANHLSFISSSLDLSFLFCAEETAIFISCAVLRGLKWITRIFLEYLCSCYVRVDSSWHNGRQHARLLCPSLSPGVCWNSCPLSQWCHPIISSSVIPFSCLQSFPGPFSMSQFFTSGGQSIRALASASVLPMNIQDLFPLGLTSLISLQFKGLSCNIARLLSNVNFFLYLISFLINLKY